MYYIGKYVPAVRGGGGSTHDQVIMERSYNFDMERSYKLINCITHIIIE